MLGPPLLYVLMLWLVVRQVQRTASDSPGYVVRSVAVHAVLGAAVAAVARTPFLFTEVAAVAVGAAFGMLLRTVARACLRRRNELSMAERARS